MSAHDELLKIHRILLAPGDCPAITDDDTLTIRLLKDLIIWHRHQRQMAFGPQAWVRCAERMPERWESVLLALGGMVPMTTFVWSGERWQVGVSDTQYPYSPEFWMPMPKAPNP